MIRRPSDVGARKEGGDGNEQQEDGKDDPDGLAVAGGLAVLM